jgi:FixJ family two-component response regulator
LVDVPPVIWIIDNNHWERAGIRALLMEHGFTVEGFVSISKAMLMFSLKIVEKPAAILLDIKNLTYMPIEVDELAGLEVPIVLLTGVFEAGYLPEKYKWAEVLRRPFTMGQAADLVERLVGEGE